MASRSVLPLIRRARAGDAASQFELGKLYLDGGQGLGANQHSALLWLDKAAQQGNTAAWRLIGERVSPAVADNGQNSRNLIRWYELAANEGCASAQTKLAQLLLSGRHASAPPNPGGWAIQLLRRAAAKGHATAWLELGACLLRNQTDADPDTGEAVKCLEQAYAAGKSAAASHLGEHYWRTGNPELAYLWYSRCADLRNVELCYRFGMLSALLGKPGGHFLERAAAGGHALACEELGFEYALGSRHDSGAALSSRNFKQSVRWLERAASLGSAKACFFLALLLEHRNCSFRSRDKAQEWLLEAARRGHAEAQYRAGLRLLRAPTYTHRAGVQETGSDEADVAAIRFLAAAARQGYAPAARALDDSTCRAPQLDAMQAAQWAQAVASMTPLSVAVAMRIELACVFGLRVCEMIMIDPVSAHRGDCFVIDLRDTGVKLRRRIVLIEDPAQRETADKASSLFRGTAPVAGDLHGSYAARYQQLMRRCLRAGVDLHNLRQHAVEIQFPSPVGSGSAEEQFETIPLPVPLSRSSALQSNDRSAARLSEM